MCGTFIYVYGTWRIGAGDLHYGGRQIGEEGGGTVVGTQAGAAAVDVGTAVFTAENGPFREDGKAVQRGGAGVAHHGIGQHPVVEGQVDAVMAAVEGHGLHIDIGSDELCAPDPGVGGGVQKGLGAGG